jgi:hypothetical protein
LVAAGSACVAPKEKPEALVTVPDTRPRMLGHAHMAAGASFVLSGP